MMSRLMGGAARLLERFTRSQKGNVAMMAGIAVPVLLMISAGAIDLHNAAKVKSELQDALDAATLAAARSNTTNPADIQNIGMASLRANMPKYFELNGGDVAEFKLDSRYKVQSTATVQVKTIVANVFLPPYGKLFDDYLPMSAGSEVLRASRNVEVSIALDVTGSMSPYMKDLEGAAKELVGIVVQGDQGLFTTKVALVPYSAGVNADKWAGSLRGGIDTSRPAISTAAWFESEKTITGISNSTKTFTLPNHGLKVGDVVLMRDFASTSGLNDKTWKIASVSGSNFTIQSPPTNIRSSLGKFRKCIDNSCNLVVTTSSDHNLVDGETVKIENTSGISGLNGYHAITLHRPNNVTDPKRFVVPMSVAGQSSLSPTLSGSNRRVICGRDGCQTRIFETYGNGTRKSASDRFTQELGVSTCISERPRGTARAGVYSAPSDSAPKSGNYLGRSYLFTGRDGNACPSQPLVPLTNSLTDLNKAIEDLRAAGSTAGQVGIEMAWYMISPNFGAIDNVTPNPFEPDKTVKAVVLMTDGEFNTAFCTGVIARTDVDGAGDNAHKINCDPTNGNGYVQSVALCNAMKAQGITIYTVAFNLKSGRGGSGVDTAVEVMETCATDKDENFFQAGDGTDLKEAFKQIGRDITRLRIAR